MRKLIPTEAKVQIYKTAILPHVTYCNLVWHFCKAEWVNERGVRAVFCDWNLAYDDLLKCANFFSLYNMRLQDIAIFMYKVKHRLLPSNILHLFSGTPTSGTTSGTQISISPDSILSTFNGKHSLRYFGPYLWSKLGHSGRQMSTLTSFAEKTSWTWFQITSVREIVQCC